MEVVENWIAEFLIRRQQNPSVSQANLLSALKVVDSPDCLKLKVSSVLRDISNYLIRGTVDEETLYLLEILEKLLLHQNSLIMESHKSAYCWTAAECTLKFMWPLSASDGLFANAIERIWTKRIGILKESGSDLVTPELLKWETDLRKALEDPQLYQQIRETNIRYTAISFLTQLLKEQWELLGSSSLESVAQKIFRKHKAQNVEGDVVDNREDPNAAADVNMRRLESDTIENSRNTQEQRGEKENGNVNNRENANDVGVGCVENDVTDKVNVADEEQTVGAQEQEHQLKFDKGDTTVARKLKDYLLEIQGQIDPSTSTRQVQEPNNGINHSVDGTPQQPTRVNRTGTDNQSHNEAPDSVNEKGSESQGTLSGRVRPRLPTPTPVNVSPLNKASPIVRRPKKFWTPEEVEALKEGVNEFGKSWRDIKNANPAVFRERTEVDLKDKWRNLFR